MGHVTRVGCSSVALVGRGAWFVVLGSGSMVRGAWPSDKCPKGGFYAQVFSNTRGICSFELMNDFVESFKIHWIQLWVCLLEGLAWKFVGSV
jgi:hypothetical protein